jgi:hypothetical protein
VFSLGSDPKENTSIVVLGTDPKENTAFNNSPIVALWGGIPHIGDTYSVGLLRKS